MKKTIFLGSFGFLVLLCFGRNETTTGQMLTVEEMRNVVGGQEDPGDPGQATLNRHCAHIDHGSSANPCAADVDCPSVPESCAGVQEYESSNTFWKCIVWLTPKRCGLSTETATCLFSVPCVLVNGICVADPDPNTNGTSLVTASTSCVTTNP